MCFGEAGELRGGGGLRGCYQTDVRRRKFALAQGREMCRWMGRVDFLGGGVVPEGGGVERVGGVVLAGGVALGGGVVLVGGVVLAGGSVLVVSLAGFLRSRRRPAPPPAMARPRTRVIQPPG